MAAIVGRGTVTAMREYESFESALRDSDSYEDPRLVEVVSEKTRRYRETLACSPLPSIETRQTVQNMFVVSYVEPRRPLNVLEVGGACGAGYLETKQLLPGRIEQWSIAETPAMAMAGRSLTNEPALSFHTDLASAASVLASRDLAIAQGALQYAGDPLQMLQDLFKLDLSYVYVTRTVVTNSEGQNVGTPIFTKQDTYLSAHGPGSLPATIADGRSSQPLTLVKCDSVFSSIPATYQLLFRFAESEDRSLSIGGRSVTVHDIGFLARKRERGESS